MLCEDVAVFIRDSVLRNDKKALSLFGLFDSSPGGLTKNITFFLQSGNLKERELESSESRWMCNNTMACWHILM